MRHEFTRRCVTLGSALAIGMAALTASSQAEQPESEPKQKALVSFKLDFLSRFKKDEQATSSAEARPEVVPASAVEPLPSNSGAINAVPATNAPTQPLTAAAAQGQYPSVLPPSVPPVQLTSGQFPLPAAGQMPFQTAQSPVVVMMPAGWQPDGNYTFAPRTVLSPEVPAEHWPSSQRNPMGDGSRKGLFDWPQIAKKITNSTIGEPEIKPQAPAPEPSTSRALFAGAPAAPQAIAVQPQAAPVVPQAAPAATQELPVAAAAPQTTTPVAPAAEAQPSSKALFAPQPAEPEPQPEESKTRALFSLLAKPMKKPTVAPPSAGSKALFAFGRKKEEPAEAPAPAVVPQYAAETPMPPDQSAPTMAPTTTVEAIDPELQPPAPPSVSNPLPGQLQTVKSDDPKMKWRAKGAPAQVVDRAAVASDAAHEAQPRTVTVQATESVEPTSDRPVTTATMDPPAAEMAPAAISSHAPHRHVQHQPNPQVASPMPASRERSLLGKHFPTMSNQTPRIANDSRSPWRRQAERDAAVAAEKQVEQPAPNSKAILPNVAALLPALEKPNRPTHSHHKAEIKTVAATEDSVERSHPVQRAHETSARSTDSYYAAPWESDVEAELEAIERRQIGAVSNRRAAIARQTMEREEETIEQQPRVPFEVDELEQEKAAVRRTAKTPRTPSAARPKSNNPAGSPSNGARMAEQRSKKSYRRLTSDDMKQGLARPLAVFSDMTKLPSPLKTAADSVDRRQETPDDEYAGDAEVEQVEMHDDQPEQPAPPKRSSAKRQPVHELRQSTAAAASITKLEDRELLASEEEDQPASLGQRGGRRQVERTARTSRVQQELEEQEEADSGVVTADDADDQEVDEEFDDETPVRPAVHIRNKHGNRVKIFTGATAADDSAAE